MEIVITSDTKPRFKIGQEFVPDRKYAVLHTIVDIITSRNDKNEVVGFAYKCNYIDQLGNHKTPYHCEVTVAKGIDKLYGPGTVMRGEYLK